jgi:hypothetical protein|tara:strand:- start:229 stop:510 length:282 start_codon:yes stop_codon:yes gene_type:complete
VRRICNDSHLATTLLLTDAPVRLVAFKRATAAELTMVAAMVLDSMLSASAQRLDEVMTSRRRVRSKQTLRLKVLTQRPTTSPPGHWFLIRIST